MLVLRALGLGDFLTAVPALRALRAARPDHELVLAAPATLEPLARLSGAVDRLHPTADLESFVLPSEPVDVVVNLHGTGPQSHQALRASDAREFLAFGRPSIGYAGPVWRAEEHEVRRWCRLVTEGWSSPADPDDLALPVPAPDPTQRLDGAIVVHPGAAYPARRWPVERFTEIAAWARAGGSRVLVTGSPDEVPLAQAVATGAGLPAESVLAGATTLVDLATVVAHAGLVVCGDTGIAHLASAYCTPSVVLFGPTPPARWGPPESGPHVAIWKGTGVGDPWAGAVDAALLAISTPEVLEHAERLLDHAPRREPRR